MATTAGLSGRLPEPDLNGLSPIAPRCAVQTEDQITVIARLSVRSIEHNMKSGDSKVKFELDHVEPVDGADETFVLSLLNSATERRTGKVEIDGFGEAFNGQEPRVRPPGVSEEGEIEE